MALDWRPSWATGHATVRELEAQLPSLRVVFAGYEAAKNAGLDISYYTLVGDGHQTGIWEAGVFGSERSLDVYRHLVTPPDEQRIGAFIRHWKRLVSRGDWHLRVKDSVSGRIVANV